MIVIKYGGSLLEDASHQAVFLGQVARLPKVCRPIILVHGGGKEITQALESEAIPTRFVDGRRYTDEAAMAVVERVLAQINERIVRILKEQGADAKGFSGQWNRLMLAQPLPGLGRVGEPRQVNEDVLRQALGEAAIPVFYSVALGPDAKPLNINADDFAMALAIQGRARRLIFLTDTGAILDPSGKPIDLLTGKAVNALIADGMIRGGMAVKARACLEAVRKGVGRVDVCKGIDALAAAADSSLGGTGFVL